MEELEQGMWKEWLTMRTTELYLAELREAVRRSLEVQTKLLMGSEDKETAWKIKCEARGAYMALSSAINVAESHGGE